MPKQNKEPRTDTAPKSSRTRERILDSAAYILSQKGYAGTRLADVADHAEVQAPAIYYYFESRDKLIEEVMSVGAFRVRHHIEETLDALPSDASALNRIIVAAEAHIRYTLAISDYTTAAIRNAGQIPPDIRPRQEKEQALYGSIWKALFEEARRSGEIRSDVDLFASRMLIIGALNWAAEWWNAKNHSIDAIVFAATTLIRSGLAPPRDAV